jgi:glutathione S-transferase
VNPKGAVPTFVTNNEEVITENAVILQYLADSDHDGTLLPPVGELKRYRILEWLNYVATDIHKGFGPIFNTTVPDQLKTDIFIPILIKKFTFANKNLQQKKFLMGDDFTLPDAYLFVMLKWAYGKNFDLSQCTELTRYYDELQNRKSITQSLQQEAG